MIITEFDKPLAAEDARKISINNRDDSIERSQFRDMMASIREQASFGYTRYTILPATVSRLPNEHVQKALSSLGYKVVVKRYCIWEDGKLTDKPDLDEDGQERFFIEIMWG